MKRLRHWLFNLAAGVSLLLAVAIAIMGTRSFFWSDFIFYGYVPDCVDYICTGKGLVAFNIQEIVPQSGFAVPTGGLHWASNSDADYPLFSGASHWWERLGFWSIEINQSPVKLRRWVVPFWLPLAMTLILPVWAAIQILTSRRHRFRQEHGLCPTCGYDLRATPERCPECGMIPEGMKA